MIYCVYLIRVVKIQSYYETKEKRPALYTLSGPSKYKAFLESGTVFMLPRRDQRGREIYVFRMGNCRYHVI